MIQHALLILAVLLLCGAVACAVGGLSLEAGLAAALALFTGAFAWELEG